MLAEMNLDTALDYISASEMPLIEFIEFYNDTALLTHKREKQMEMNMKK